MSNYYPMTEVSREEGYEFANNNNESKKIRTTRNEGESYYMRRNKNLVK
jgi:hypothetical protein